MWNNSWLLGHTYAAAMWNNSWLLGYTYAAAMWNNSWLLGHTYAAVFLHVNIPPKAPGIAENRNAKCLITWYVLLDEIISKQLSRPLFPGIVVLHSCHQVYLLPVSLVERLFLSNKSHPLQPAENHSSYLMIRLYLQFCWNLNTWCWARFFGDSLPIFLFIPSGQCYCLRLRVSRRIRSSSSRAYVIKIRIRNNI